MENTNLEKHVKNSTKPISLKGMNNITEQMKYSICKIHKEGISGTGFLCNLPYKSNKILFLITNNHILNEKDIKKDNIIEISFNNEEFFMNIPIDESRRTLTNKDLDFTLIEIKDNEKKYYENKCNESKKKDVINSTILELGPIPILEVDENYNKIDEQSLNKIYIHNSIYTLHYPKDDEIFASFGLIKNINKEKDKNKIKVLHSCSTEDGSSGAPILSLKDFKVVGLHYGSSQNDFNEGTFIKSIISELEKCEFSRNENNKPSQLNVSDILINNSININYINNFPEKIISKNEYSQTILSFHEENCHYLNIIFEDSSNFKTVIIIPSNKDASILFDIYKRNRKDKGSSKDELLFVFNGSIINTNQNIKISEIFQNFSKLTVLDKT